MPGFFLKKYAVVILMRQKTALNRFFGEEKCRKKTGSSRGPACPGGVFRPGKVYCTLR